MHLCNIPFQGDSVSNKIQFFLIKIFLHTMLLVVISSMSYRTSMLLQWHYRASSLSTGCHSSYTVLHHSIKTCCGMRHKPQSVLLQRRWCVAMPLSSCLRPQRILPRLSHSLKSPPEDDPCYTPGNRQNIKIPRRIAKYEVKWTCVTVSHTTS